MDPQAQPQRRQISIYRHGAVAIRTFYDDATRRWHLEHWDRGRLVEVLSRTVHPEDLEFEFRKRVADTINRAKAARTPVVNKDHLPPGKITGVRVIDPAKARGRRFLTLPA
jgi:hypothetical protein